MMGRMDKAQEIVVLVFLIGIALGAPPPPNSPSVSADASTGASSSEGVTLGVPPPNSPSVDDGAGTSTDNALGEGQCKAGTKILDKETLVQFEAKCDEFKYFFSLQCNKGKCWCVLPATGEEIDGTRNSADLKIPCGAPITPQNYKLIDDDGTVAMLETGIGSQEQDGDQLFSSGRPGSATDWHNCGKTTSVPRHLTFITRYNYYRKYKEAYNIPIVSSAAVSEAALRRACYVLLFLFADRKALRQSMYKNYGRLAVIGRNEGTTHIPEHRHLGAWWNTRARGLGGTLHIPVSSGGEENLLCERGDRYPREDIFLHEFTHGIEGIGVRGGGIPGYYERLRAQYYRARSRGLWRNTYAMSTEQEYFGEGTQSYFEVNNYSPRPDGIHGPTNTRAKLQRYDPALYNLVREVFPCGNRIWKRCDAKRGSKMPAFYMNCDGNGRKVLVTDMWKNPFTGTTGGGGKKVVVPGGGKKTGGGKEFVCTSDKSGNCGYWSKKGFCKPGGTWAKYMVQNCAQSCRCCTDKDSRCPGWKNYCSSNVWMKANCWKTCNICGQVLSG